MEWMKAAPLPCGRTFWLCFSTIVVPRWVALDVHSWLVCRPFFLCCTPVILRMGPNKDDGSK